MSSLNKNIKYAYSDHSVKFLYEKCHRKREGVRLEKILLMASISSYHSHNLTSNSSGELLGLMYCDLNPIHSNQLPF
jgi:hypothetical protein